MAAQFSLTYYRWITQTISGRELAAAIRRFADQLAPELTKLLGQPVTVDVSPEMEVPDQLQDIKAPPTDKVVGKIALMNPLGYALAHRDSAAVEAVAVVRRKIGNDPAGPSYKAQIYCHVDSEIRGLAGLRGRSFGFGSPQSTSNFLVPANNLLRAGLHPLYSFARLEFSGGHDKVAKAVYERRLDAGAGHDGVILDLSTKPGYSHASDRLVRLAWSEPIVSDPIAVHVPDHALRDGVQAALLAVAKPDEQNSPGNEAVYGFWGTREGFEAISPDQYAPLLDYLPPLRLSGDDLLRKW
jgi:phosphonate transport system substrate-binding protein